MRDDLIEAYKQIRKSIKTGDTSEFVRLVDEDESLLQLDSPFGTCLHMAAAHGKLAIVQWLVSHGMDVNTRAATIEGRPLDEAASNAHLDVVKFLIERGATLDVSESVRNPLLSAIVGGLSDSHTAVAKLLIDAGIDTSIRYPNLDNMNALEYAKEWGRSDIVALLEAQSK
ncbi:MAG: ankyrin repeat domain-containing protein [Pirellulales bacterium]